MLRISVAGSNGKMGSRIKTLVGEDRELSLAGAFDVKDDARTAIERGDVLIEFTTPAATIDNLKIAVELKKAVVIGTTGIDENGISSIKEAAASIPIVYSPNMAVGVNLLFKIVQESATVLSKTFASSIEETHQRYKKDAPSGTAKALQKIIADNAKIDLRDIKVESKRIGDVVGDHTVIFDGKEERIEITHHAKSRDIFVKGAIVAAKFIRDKKPGLYTMNEVLGI